MIERVFTGWHEPILPAAARVLAERYAKEKVLDLGAVALAVPGARAGRRLKELLLAESQRAGLRLLPPRVVTTGSLPELFYEPQARIAPPLVTRRAWAEALRRASRPSIGSVFNDLPEQDDLLGWDRLGAQLATLQQEVAGGCHTFADVARICGSGELDFDDGARWRVLAEQQERYRSILDASGFTDVHLARIDALRGHSVAATVDVWLVGVAELPLVTRALLARATSPVAAIVHAPPGEASNFDGLGCVHPAAWEHRSIRIEPEQMLVADRPFDQAAELLRQTELLGDDYVPEMAIGITDPALVPYVGEWFEATGLSTHYAGGTAMDRTGPHRLLVAVADYLERRGWEEFAALVRHPRIEGRLRLKATAGVSALEGIGQIDRDFGAHLPAEVRGGRETSAAMGEIDRARRRLESPDLLGHFSGKRPLSEWGEPILAFLREAYGGQELHPNDPAARRLIEVLGRIRAAALAIHRLPAALAPVASAAAALRLLSELIGGDIVPDEGEPDSIELLGWLELVMDDAPVALLAGFNEGFLPDSRNADPFLPDQLRTRLGLLDNLGRYGRDAFLLTALLHSRRAVRLIAGRLTAEGDPLRPSRLALTSRGEELAGTIHRLYRSVASPIPLDPPLVASAGEVSEFGLPPVQSFQAGPPAELRVTDFAAILKDPFRYLLERRLCLERVGDEAREMAGSDFGSFAHAILGKLGDSPEIESTDVPSIVRRLDAILDAEVAARFGEVAFPAVHLQAEQLRVRLHAFAAWQAGWAADGWRVVLIEGRPVGAGTAYGERAPPASFEVDGEPILLTGRIDRVDHHPATNRFAIFDYKSGDRHPVPDEVHRKKRSGEWKDLQLPLYRHLLAAALDATGRPLLTPGARIELGYIALSKELAKVGAEMAGWSDDELRQADEAARDVVRSLRHGVITFDRSRTTTWPGDELAPLLGMRLLLSADEDAETAEEVE